MRALLGVFFLAALLSGCSRSHVTHMSLPVLPGWYNGEQVYYLTTDISDAQMATVMQANYVPRLANALPDEPGPHPLATYDRVYKFVDDSQASVFPSIPLPLGGDNQDMAYSPLWHVYEVRWLSGTPGSPLRSADAVLQAQEQGLVSVRASGIIVNCPVVAVGEQRLQ
ncbi:hypothetical protein SAMN05216370_1638 [Pseudomonas peli]|uniref:DUF7482 domain-containing protein n=1 Tax=Pseudomonas peli TaxID=592361 RepID=A0AB37Z649_9PSED|nr:hypothetical protein [Pseudomonas peli]NMZ68111.1 hypothetical protein [Pseudomonas peli]SCW49751.1 hypothetical protein SAMN05216370_1638 [Pseudomonas peli]